MKLTSFLLFLVLTSGPGDISKVNGMKERAEKAFQAGNFQEAASIYSTLYDSMSIQDDAIGLNLGHALFAMGDSAKAKTTYQRITTSNNKKLKSIAHQQLGVMAKNPKTLEESLAQLKSALKTDPTNEGARYDYEVVKKLLEQQQEQNKDKQDENKDQENQDQKNEDQQNQDQQNQDQQNQDQEKQDQEKQDQENQDQQDQEKKDQESKDQKEGEEQQPKDGEEQQKENQQQSTKEKLEDMNISEEKARMILEAMKNNEVQYIQQQKRKATKPKDSGKPDW